MKSRGVGKPGKLSEHFSSKAHKASLSDYVQFMSNNSGIDTLLDKEIRTKAIQIEEDTENNRSIIKIIIDLCQTMAREAYPFGAPNRTPMVILGSEVPCIPCQGHRSNTINEHACAASPIVPELFNTLKATYAFFSGSTKRHSLLNDELENAENSLKLRNLSLTRWTARAESLRAMWVSYEAVLDVLETISNTASVDAKGKAAATGTPTPPPPPPITMC